MIYPAIKSTLEEAASLVISDERKVLLNQLIDYLRSTSAPKLNFICTHNSRRSHLSQIWAQAVAHYFGKSIETYSGGTEATAFNSNAVEAVKEAGFQVESGAGDNPKYEVAYSDEADAIIAYSKRFDDAVNPQSGFAAILTCSEADAECPVVFGADKRIKLFYEDPKVSDGTGKEHEVYGSRSLQIASELHYVFSQLKD